MNITKGFRIEDPDVEIPWGIAPRALRRLLGSCPFRKVNEDYYHISCVSLIGLRHELGFRFDPPFPWTPRLRRRLIALEFFRTQKPGEGSVVGIRKSFSEFQDHLERTFGPPHESHESEGFPAHSWRFSNVEIGHSVFERFVLNETVRIWVHS